MRRITEERVLIIADVHQNFAYVDACLKEDFDRVVFLGDWLDTYRPIDGERILSVEKTCLRINDLFKSLGDKAVWLFGNHDLAYFATYTRTGHAPKGNPYWCGGYTRNKACTFNKRIDPEWIRGCELCVGVGPYMLSHAGFSERFLSPYREPWDSAEATYIKWQVERDYALRSQFHWIGEAGKCRGGDFSSGSPIWLDWDEEFKPIEGMLQIVGHTNSGGAVHKPKDHSYCLDEDGSCYAIWDKSLQIKRLKNV